MCSLMFSSKNKTKIKLIFCDEKPTKTFFHKLKFVSHFHQYKLRELAHHVMHYLHVSGLADYKICLW